MTDIKFRCPTCHGCQYRFSLYNITPQNPHGARCIFCKTKMTVSYKAFVR
ncbi:cold-shock protein [Kalamiella sp. sgz302252]